MSQYIEPNIFIRCDHRQAKNLEDSTIRKIKETYSFKEVDSTV